MVTAQGCSWESCSLGSCDVISELSSRVCVGACVRVGAYVCACVYVTLRMRVAAGSHVPLVSAMSFRSCHPVCGCVCACVWVRTCARVRVCVSSHEGCSWESWSLGNCDVISELLSHAYVTLPLWVAAGSCVALVTVVARYNLLTYSLL